MELPEIFPRRFVTLDKVKNELLKRDGNYLAINMFLGLAKVPEVKMPTGEDIVQEYFALKKVMDDGEAACLAVGRLWSLYFHPKYFKSLFNLGF